MKMFSSGENVPQLAVVVVVVVVVVFHNCSVLIHLVKSFYQQPMSEGYIAIVMPKHENADTVCNHLLPEEEYQLICQQRNTKGQE